MTIEGGTKSTEEVTGRILEFLARELSYNGMDGEVVDLIGDCLLYTSPSPRD